MNNLTSKSNANIVYILKSRSQMKKYLIMLLNKKRISSIWDTLLLLQNPRNANVATES